MSEIAPSRPTITRSASREPLRLVVHYPRVEQGLRLRCDQDWERDLLPLSVSADATEHCFAIVPSAPYHHVKPVLHAETGPRWSCGENVVLLPGRGTHELWPHFDTDDRCHVCTLHSPPAPPGAEAHAVRVWLPAGYGENTLARYPVLYMHDGQNLFLPEDSFAGETWRAGETMKLLDAMCMVRPAIIVGIYPVDRMREYTTAGNEAYARYLCETLKPWVDAHYRSLPGPEHTAVMGSSLGGLVSLHLAWSRPEVFGMAGCLSSTFGFDEELFRRIERGQKRPFRVYLDSGWPRDNYEVTRAMKALLLEKGWREGEDLFHFAFPEALHDERSWATRVHLPFQLFFGARR